MKKYISIKAFTLAEILLTLVIIGVVSALTVPTLRNHSDEAKYVASTQKAMSEVASAVASVELLHGDASTWNFDSENTKNWFKQTMNLVSLADGDSAWNRYDLSGGDEAVFHATFMTVDGMAWSVGSGNYPCGGGAILIDVNGPKPPNTIGIDMHGFRVGHLCGGSEGRTKTGDFGIYAMGDGVNDLNGDWACSSYIIRHKKMPWLYSSEKKCSSYMGK